MRMHRCLAVIAVMTVLMGVTHATEFRSPLIVERGPMRYVFEEWEEDDYGLKVWSACYGREAHKSFLSHGMNTHHLSALIFGKSDFTLNEALPYSHAELGTEYYSPYLSTITLSPRVTYEEKGVSLGFRWSYPVYKNKTRVGIRGQVPFRKIEMEREDFGDESDDQLADVLTREVVTRDAATDVWASAIRMDFLQSLPYTDDGVPILSFSTSGVPDLAGNSPFWTGLMPDHRAAAVIESPEGTVPKKPDRLVGIYESASTPPTDLPSDGNVPSDATQYAFASGVDYSGLNMNTGTQAQQELARNRTAGMWVTTVHNIGDGEALNGTSNSVWELIDLALKNYEDNAYVWLADRGFVFESNTRSGIGDVDIDLFVEHQFSDDLVGELFLGVRLPVGANDNYCCNPYRAQLGNGYHWEIRGGALVAWQPSIYVNVKLDGYVSFVLDDEEKRMATFCGAGIKNMGPCIRADVNWQYFVGHLDFNLFHPKTDAISTVLGYEFYYKTEDNIKYKCRTAESWLGKKYNSTTQTYDDNYKLLDPSVAERNTEAIAHKIRMESSFRITRWFEIFCGWSYTLAGQNVPRESDAHGGFVVTF